MNLNGLTGQIVDAAIHVHTALGPGLLESAYRICLAIELRKRGLKVLIEIPVSFVYEGVEIENAYKIDMLVNDCVIVETKAVSKLNGIHEAQLLSHLRLADKRVGLPLNFHEAHLRDGIRRMVNKFPASAPSASLRPLRPLR